MKDVLFYIALGILGLLILAQLQLILSRMLLRYVVKRRDESIRKFNAAKRQAAASKRAKFGARLESEIAKGLVGNKSVNKDLN